MHGLHYLRDHLLALVGQCGSLLVLTDLFGATPSNVAQRLVQRCAAQGSQVREVTGVNVPMLLRVITYRERAIEVLVKKAVAGACEGVVHMK